jgi:hypothetical protein
MEFIEIFFSSLRLAIQDLKEDRKTFQASLKASPKFDSELLRFIGVSALLQYRPCIVDLGEKLRGSVIL